MEVMVKGGDISGVWDHPNLCSGPAQGDTSRTGTEEEASFYPGLVISAELFSFGWLVTYDLLLENSSLALLTLF